MAGSALHIRVLLLFIGLICGGRGARVLPGAAGNCSQQGLSCSFSSSNCLDPGWLVSHSYTPSGPELLDLKISIRDDPEGNKQPVINATWRLRDDGSIMFLRASELQVLVVSTNQNFCVRFSFNNTLSMRNPAGEQWTLRSDVVVVDPGQWYKVSVENIPKAELNHNSLSVSRDLQVPDCSDSVMKNTQFCIESGSLWTPGLSVARSGLVLVVTFHPHTLSERYSVLCRCRTSDSVRKTPAGNSSTLTASFSLDLWPVSCCRFHVEVVSHFPRCGSDCRREWTSVDLCSPRPTESAGVWRPLPVALGAAAALIIILILGVCVAICKRGGAAGPRPQLSAPFEQRLEKHPTLLLIYSRDHPLYLQVVLKLAAFLHAQCGVRVLLDLLDSRSVGQMGVVRWLELQRQNLGRDDKILVLCSRGVQSRWKAMCGQGHVTPQPDDLIGPFLSLFLSDMHTPQSRGRYIAAFFEDVSSERDVPSFFDVAVKYKLMKHVEELFFRLLDMEKYEPRRVNHVRGVGPDEYWTCESGRALRLALHKFSTFQSHAPDWFQTAEPRDDSPLLEKTPLPQIFMCTPVVRGPAPLYARDVTASDGAPVCVLEPEARWEAPVSQNEPLASFCRHSLLQLEPDPPPEARLSERVPAATPSEEEAEFRASDDDHGRGRSQSGASDQGYGSAALTEDDHMRALLRLQQELSGICHE